MAYLNLLPWREALRQRKNKQFVRWLYLTLMVALLIVAVMWSYMHHIESNQKKVNHYILNHNLQLEKELAKKQQLATQYQAMISQIILMQEIQNKRQQIVQIWADVANTLPTSLYLTGFKRESTVFTLIGKSNNTAQVSQWVEKLEDSEGIASAKLQSISQSHHAENNSIATAKQATVEGKSDVLIKEDTKNYPNNMTYVLDEPTIGQAVGTIEEKMAVDIDFVITATANTTQAQHYRDSQQDAAQSAKQTSVQSSVDEGVNQVQTTVGREDK